MLYVKNSELEWTTFKDWHNMDAGFSDQLPTNQSADVMFARISPGKTLESHYHKRPLDNDGKDNGYESFFFYQGGNLLLLKRTEEIHLKIDEPFSLTFFSHEEEMHGIKNLGDKDLVFQVICAPRFTEKEEIHVIK